MRARSSRVGKAAVKGVCDMGDRVRKVCGSGLSGRRGGSGSACRVFRHVVNQRRPAEVMLRLVDAYNQRTELASTIKCPLTNRCWKGAISFIAEDAADVERIGPSCLGQGYLHV